MTGETPLPSASLKPKRRNKKTRKSETNLVSLLSGIIQIPVSYTHLEDSSEVLEHGDFWVDAWQPEGSPKYTRQRLQQEFSMGKKRELCLFWGHQPAEDGQLTKSCLSQWWMEDFWSVANTYLCMEQYMMAGKAELFGDQEIREQILKCSDPKQIKALGRKVRGFCLLYTSPCFIQGILPMSRSAIR